LSRKRTGENNIKSRAVLSRKRTGENIKSKTLFFIEEDRREYQKLDTLVKEEGRRKYRK
jgi:hypothetical protein